MIINDPETIAEVEAALSVYERALAENDVAALDAIFWDNDQTVRFGADETLIGADAIKSYRGTRARTGSERAVLRTVISAFGDGAATVSIVFRREGAADRTGRWTQTWIKFADGWHIVAAHVSSIDSSS